MDERLNDAPGGYLSLSDNGTILCINQTLLKILDYNEEEVQGNHINTILSKPSQTFYQLYFFPMMKVQGKVEEMHFSLKRRTGHDIPVLLNAVRKKRKGITVNDCILFPMRRRLEFEQAILAAKKLAEESERSKEKAIFELEEVQRELENRQREILELNEEFKQLAITDELTGLNNRRYYEQALTKNFILYNSYSTPFSLLIIDIDCFKKVNDTNGHMVGDQILQNLANILYKELRKSDILSRYGGEEFTLILPNTTEEESLKIAERIRMSVEKTKWSIDTITVSIGIATTIVGDTKEDIQSRADKALYLSKNNGRNQVTHSAYMNVI